MSRVGYIGRDAALAEVRAAVDDAADARGQLMLVVGDAGIGKTALAREAVRHAGTHGLTVVWATCWDGDGAPPYWPWVQVLRSLSALGVPLPPEARRIIPEPKQPRGMPAAGSLLATGDEAVRALLFEAVSDVLERAWARTPLLVVIDDLHWADVPSLLLLRFVGHRVANRSALILGLFRAGEVVDDRLRRPVLADLRRDADVVELTGLDERGVAQMMSSIGDVTPSGAVLASVFRRTGATRSLSGRSCS